MYDAIERMAFARVAIEVDHATLARIDDGDECLGRILHKRACGFPHPARRDAAFALLPLIEMREHIVAACIVMNLPADAHDRCIGIRREHSIFTGDFLFAVVILCCARIVHRVRAIGLAMEHHRGAGKDDGNVCRRCIRRELPRPRHTSRCKMGNGIWGQFTKPRVCERRIFRRNLLPIPTSHIPACTPCCFGENGGQCPVQSRDKKPLVNRLFQLCSFAR